MRGITLGTFDLTHNGHVKLLRKCKILCDYLVVGLNTDEFILKYKGKAPIMTYDERYTAIFDMGIADEIVPNDQITGNARKVILDSEAQLIIVGSDWAVKDYVGQLGINWDWLDRHGIGICYLNYTKGISTTELKRRIHES